MAAKRTINPGEQIAERRAKIQCEWSPKERLRRRDLAILAQQSLLKRLAGERRRLAIA